MADRGRRGAVPRARVCVHEYAQGSKSPPLRRRWKQRRRPIMRRLSAIDRDDRAIASDGLRATPTMRTARRLIACVVPRVLEPTFPRLVAPETTWCRDFCQCGSRRKLNALLQTLINLRLRSTGTFERPAERCLSQPKQAAHRHDDGKSMHFKVLANGKRRVWRIRRGGEKIWSFAPQAAKRLRGLRNGWLVGGRK